MAFTVLLKARSPPKRRVHRCQNLLERVHFGLRDAVHTPAWKHARRGRAAGLPRGMFRLGIWAAIPFTLLHFIMALLALLYVDQESPGAELERAKTSSERVHVFTEHGKRKRKRQNHTGTVERLVLNSGDKPPIEHGTREREREREKEKEKEKEKERDLIEQKQLLVKMVPVPGACAFDHLGMIGLYRKSSPRHSLS